MLRSVNLRKTQIFTPLTLKNRKNTLSGGRRVSFANWGCIFPLGRELRYECLQDWKNLNINCSILQSSDARTWSSPPDLHAQTNIYLFLTGRCWCCVKANSSEDCRHAEGEKERKFQISPSPEVEQYSCWIYYSLQGFCYEFEIGRV